MKFYHIIKFNKVPELFRNREVRVVGTEQLVDIQRDQSTGYFIYLFYLFITPQRQHTLHYKHTK